MQLVSPCDGIVSVRDAEPGTTVVAGEPVVEVIDPKSLWVNVRFDQLKTAGLAVGFPARIALRSSEARAYEGHLLRIEPVADAVTEESLAKVVFDSWPSPLPPIGELAEVTVALAPAPPAPMIPNAALMRSGDAIGVWKIDAGVPRFVPVRVGAADLDGHTQIRAGLEAGDRIVVYSERALDRHSRLRVVDHLAGVGG